MKFSVILFTLAAATALNITAEMTFYGAKDKPPGGSISYPNAQHPEAGGVGTYTDPITFAGSPHTPGFVPGKIVLYNFALSKYFALRTNARSA